MANKAFKIKHGLDVKDGALLVDPSNGNIITDASVSVGIGTSNITHTLTVNGDIHASGDITADGNITLGDADTDNVVFGADINSNLIPNTTDTFNLGSTTQQWNIGHFNSIAIDTAVDPTYKLTVGGSINITGNLYQNGVLFSGGEVFQLTDFNGHVHSVSLSGPQAYNLIKDGGNIAVHSSTAASHFHEVTVEYDAANKTFTASNISGHTGHTFATSGGGLPAQTDNSGKFLSTNGTTTSWESLPATLTVRDVSGTNNVADVSEIRFDDGTGFNVTDLTNGVVSIALGSHWKDLSVDGQTTLSPTGEESLEIEAGNNVVITTNATSSPKKIIIGLENGHDMSFATDAPTAANPGDEWWDTDGAILYKYIQDAAGAEQWFPVSGGSGGGGGSSVATQYEFILDSTTAGQTSFAVPYGANTVTAVYFNGLKLAGEDFSATLGTTVSLVGITTSEGDVISIRVNESFAPTPIIISQTDFVATANQTTFTVDYTIGRESVYINGFRLPKADYTADNGTSIVLDIAAAAGDDVIVVNYGAFIAVDHYTNTEVDNAILAIVPSQTGHANKVLKTDGTNATWQADLNSETTTSLSINANVLTYTDEDGTDTDIDLSLYLDDSNLARLVSGSVDAGTGIATFTRDDATTFTVDMSSLLDDTKLTDADIAAMGYIKTDTQVTVNNTLTSTSTTEALSAKQGKVLQDNKVDNSRVLTDVPSGAVFTDTVYSHPATHTISEVAGLQAELDNKITMDDVIAMAIALG